MIIMVYNRGMESALGSEVGTVQKIKASRSLGYHLKMLRLESGPGVAELTRYMQLLGCETTRECWVKIEAGKHNVSIEQLWAFKEALQISYDKIFDFMEEKKK